MTFSKFSNCRTRWLAARPRIARPVAAVVVSLLAIVTVGVLQLAQGQAGQGDDRRGRSSSVRGPEAEFHMARLIYSSGGGFRAFRPWWAIDYPEAEYHFRQGVRRLTRIDMADDSRHIELTDEALFDYPWLFAQQVGRWSLSDAETSRLRVDMGDAWEHADDPVYPEPMTTLAYRFGINYVIYAMTH